MIPQLVIASFCCLWFGGASGTPLYLKGPYAPSPPGERPLCATKSVTFCEDVEKYPTKLIQALLQTKSLDMYDLFTDESEGLDEPPDYILHQEIAPTPRNETGVGRKTRSAEDLQKISFSPMDLDRKCPIKSKVARPKIASNSEGVWRYVAQDEKSNFKQKVEVQLCDESEECDKFCKQFYAPVPMLSIHQSGEEMEKETFWMPSSCHCFLDSPNTY